MVVKLSSLALIAGLINSLDCVSITARIAILTMYLVVTALR